MMMIVMKMSSSPSSSSSSLLSSRFHCPPITWGLAMGLFCVADTSEVKNGLERLSRFELLKD
eukprot:7000049-Karenia_brevis.AAC.1